MSRRDTLFGRGDRGLKPTATVRDRYAVEKVVEWYFYCSGMERQPTPSTLTFVWKPSLEHFK